MSHCGDPLKGLSSIVEGERVWLEVSLCATCMISDLEANWNL